MPRESDLDSKIMQAIRARGGWAYKTHGGPFQPAGIPDINAVYKGRPLYVEDKIGDNGPSVIQQKQMRDLRAVGAFVCVAYSVSDVERIMDEVDTVVAKEHVCSNLTSLSWAYVAWKTGNVAGGTR